MLWSRLSLGSALAMVLSFTAQATTPITYTGSGQFQSIAASYSLTTDGTLGTLSSANLLSFSVTVSDTLSTYTFSSASGGMTSGSTFTATASNLSLSQGQSLTLYRSFSNGDGVSIGFFNDQIGAQIEDRGGYRVGTAPSTGVFATLSQPQAAPAPEPATWVMMIVGFGAIGGAMRRRQWLTARIASA